MTNLTHNNLRRWSKAHVFYDMLGHAAHVPADKYEEYEFRHNRDVIKETRNSHLLLQNQFFNDLRSSNKIYLAHTTSNLHKITESKELYASAGCLVGSVYSTPLTKDSHGLRMHNLGKYIHEQEIETYLVKDSKKNVSTLIIEVELDIKASGNLIGIDYLRLGAEHYDIYKSLEYLLSDREKMDLYQNLFHKIRSSVGFLSSLRQALFEPESLDAKSLINLLNQHVAQLPILGYFYFESLIEYIMLNQDNIEAERYREVGEFYNASYKNLVFAVCPALSTSYSLSVFKPQIETVIDYIKNAKNFSKFNESEFLEYMKSKIIYLVNTRLFNHFDHIGWKSLTWDFDLLSTDFKPLIGHLIHRELRNFGRYPHFYFYFDQLKALYVWNYWNHIHMAVPFNGIIPKGEVGINPAYPELKYKIYKAEKNDHLGFSYLTPKEELKDIAIVPKLVSLKFTLMRDNSHYKAV